MWCPSRGRWNFAVDMNCDGIFNYLDPFHWLLYLILTPGDTIVWAILGNHQLAAHLNFSINQYGGGLSFTISGLFWLIVIVVAITMRPHVKGGA